MKKNLGTTDRSIRIMIAIGIALLYFTETINGTTATVLGVLAIVMGLTSLIGFCPIYPLLGINTAKKTTEA
jgi:hypothetical protein